MRVVVHPHNRPIKFEVRMPHTACAISSERQGIVCLAVRKIWRTLCVSINGPDDLDLLTLKLVRYTSRIEGGEPSFQIWAR